MKMKTNILVWIFALLLLSACGTSQTAQQGQAQTAVQESESILVQDSVEDTEAVETLESVEMLYYLDLGDGSIMALPHGENAAWLGEDYLVVHLSDAEIYNAQGEPCTLSDLTRGCPIQVQWPGMVMESYPGQIAATSVTALSDEADPSVPPEDEIPALGGGAKWWVKEVPKDLPSLTMEYSTEDYSVAMFLGGVGSWGYPGGEIISCGDHPLYWNYDDNNTCKRVGYDSVRFTTSPTPETITVEAYVDGSEDGVSVPVREDGSIDLVDGTEVIYVIHMTWDTADYWGNGEYAVKIVTP